MSVSRRFWERNGVLQILYLRIAQSVYLVIFFIRWEDQFCKFMAILPDYFPLQFTFICECEYITSLKYLLSFLFLIIYILMIILRYNYIITKLVFIIDTKICLLLEKLYLFFIWLSNFYKYEIFPKITNIKIVELIKNLCTLLKNLNKIRENITNWFKYFWYIDILKKDQYIFFR